MQDQDLESRKILAVETERIIMTEQKQHPERHRFWYWISSIGNVKQVACMTCGFPEPYDSEKHIDVADLETFTDQIFS